MNKKNGIKGENFGGNTEVFPVGTSHYELLQLLYRTMLGVTDSYKVGENLVVIKVYSLVYMSELLKA